MHDFEFSTEVTNLKRSVMRDLLALAVDPGIISLAGGLPTGELLPIAEFQDCLHEVLSRDGSAALQYSPMYRPLQEWIQAYMLEKGVSCEPDQIFITNGAQQGQAILSRLFLNPGDVAVTEEITFTGIAASYGWTKHDDANRAHGSKERGGHRCIGNSLTQRAAPEDGRAYS